MFQVGQCFKGSRDIFKICISRRAKVCGLWRAKVSVNHNLAPLLSYHTTTNNPITPIPPHHMIPTLLNPITSGPDHTFTLSQHHSTALTTHNPTKSTHCCNPTLSFNPHSNLTLPRAAYDHGLTLAYINLIPFYYSNPTLKYY